MRNLNRTLVLTLLSVLATLVTSPGFSEFETRPGSPVLLEFPSNRGADGVDLLLDDGTAETFIGDVGQFIWLNRFTPTVDQFPFQFEEISVLFGNTAVPLGGAIELLVYSDTDGDGDPGTGAVLLASSMTSSRRTI